MYAKTRSFYEEIKKNPPSDEMCSCANDIDKNGIDDMLKYMALKIREPSLMNNVVLTSNGTHRFIMVRKEPLNVVEYQGHKDKREAMPQGGGWSDWSGNVYKLRFKRSADPEPDHKRKRSAIPQSSFADESDWSGNLYTYRFKKRSADPEPRDQSDWSGNLYSYSFKKRSADPEPGEYGDWSGNLYRYTGKRSADPGPGVGGILRGGCQRSLR